MQIGCTKKLIEYLGCDLNEYDSACSELFNFTANLITVNRRKCIVIVNDGSKCGFVIYGITAKDKKDINSLILQGIEALLKSERYSDEIIAEYLNDCQKIAYTKTANRSAVALMNKFCERVRAFSEGFEAEDIFQKKLLARINDDYVKFGNEFEITYNKLAELIEFHYGRSPFNYKAAVFDIDLQLYGTVCNRRVTVPLNITFLQFHMIIQKLFEWEDYHLHRFAIKTARNGEILEYTTMFPDEEEAFMMPGQKAHDEKRLMLSDIFPSKKKIIYEYDFGDGWIHEIRLIKTIDNCTIPAPYCESANGLAPPEDCGGPWRFSRLREILSDPKDPEYGDIVSWYGYAEIHNKTIDHMNFLLKAVLRINAEDYYDYEE